MGISKALSQFHPPERPGINTGQVAGTMLISKFGIPSLGDKVLRPPPGQRSNDGSVLV